MEDYWNIISHAPPPLTDEEKAAKKKAYAQKRIPQLLEKLEIIPALPFLSASRAKSWKQEILKEIETLKSYE